MRIRLRPGFLIIAPALVIGAIAGALLLADLNNSEEIRGTHLIGKLVKLEGRVRYKRRGDYIWKDALKNQPLYRGDLIITGAEAAAIVETESGQKIQLQAGSSVVLDDPEKLKGPDVNGSVVLRNADGEERYLATTKDGFLAVAPSSIRLIAPEELSDLFVDSTDGVTGKVAFSWKTAGTTGNTAAFLEIAPNRYFEQGNLEKYPILAGAESVSAPVSAGKHYWRIVDSSLKPLSAYRELDAHGVHPITAEIPSGPSVAWNGSLDFQWSSTAGDTLELGSHWIEISLDEKFNELVQKKQIAAQSIRSSVSDLKEGSYLWRVVSHYPGLTLAGPPMRFHASSGKQIQITEVWPRETAVLPTGARPIFQWESNVSRGNYRIEIRGPKDAVATFESTHKSFQSEELPAGAYEWRVSGTLGGLKAEGPWRKFTVTAPGALSLSSPKPGETVEVASLGVPVSFSWLADVRKTVREYALEVATDPEFQHIVGFKRGKATESTSADFNLTPGQDYFWRVSSISSSGDGLAISAPSSFRFVIYKGLPSPESLLPQDGVACNPIKVKQGCAFTWASVPGASHYEIEFFKASSRSPASDDLAKPIFKKTLSTPSFQSQNLQEGTYFWRVRAFDGSGRAGSASAPRRLTIDLGKRLLAPRTRSSEVQ